MSSKTCLTFRKTNYRNGVSHLGFLSNNLQFPILHWDISYKELGQNPKLAMSLVGSWSQVKTWQGFTLPITSKPFSLIFLIKTPLSDPPCSAGFTLETMNTLYMILLVSPPLCRSNHVMGDKQLCYRYFRRFTNSFRLPRAILHVSDCLLCVYSMPLCNLTRYIF